MPAARPTRRSLRGFVFAFFLYQFAFYNIILPGHTRGTVTVDGRPTAGACPLCCACKSDGNHSTQQPSSRDRAHCAICDFAAHVTVPEFVRFVLPALGVLHLLPVPPPAPVSPPETFSPHLCRGPPASRSTPNQFT